jgi:hypothetical protein
VRIESVVKFVIIFSGDTRDASHTCSVTRHNTNTKYLTYVTLDGIPINTSVTVKTSFTKITGIYYACDIFAYDVTD